MKNFLVYKSSAGSGKTYTLVKEYLKIILRDPGAVRNILAITFTNAAAAEMKERIIKVLGQIAFINNETGQTKTHEFIRELIAEWENQGISAPSQDQLIQNAQLALKRILHRYTDFAVSTIDSFVHRLVRTFAFDLRIPLNFEVELDAGDLLSKAIDMLISRIGKDEKLTRLLVAYMISQTDDEADTRIELKIADMAKTLTEEDSAEHISKLHDTGLDEFEQIASKLRSQNKQFEKKVRAEATAAITLIQKNSLEPSDFFQSSRGIYAYFEKLAAGNVREKITPSSNAIKTIEQDKWYSGKCPEASKQAIDSIKPQLIAAFHAIRKIANEGLSDYLARQAVLNNIYPLAVLNEVESMLEEVKSENVLLHISDFNKRIGAIVAEQPVPFIYERLGERFRHYMIDEFQDTSALQWQNLLPLIENSLAGGQMSLIVGDGKQAIYRFRNGDVEQFAMLPYLTGDIRSPAKTEWQFTLQNNYHEEPLAVNWRSAKAIVEFNNRFFKHTRQNLPEKLQSIYHGVEQEPRPDKAEGYVQIDFLEKDETQSLKELNLAKILEIIKRCLAAGHPMSDITVLCRANSDASLVASELLSHGIAVISAESLLLGYSKDVNFIVSVIRLLDDPGNKTAAVEMLDYLLSQKVIRSENKLHECLKVTGIADFERKFPKKNLHKAIEELMQKNGKDFSFNDFSHQNIYDSCESILRLFFSDQQPVNPFVAFFMDAVFDYAEKHMLSYADFLEWWEEKGSGYSIVVPEGVDAVQVMTVHKSKGLQFPVVIHPFAYQAASKPTKAGFWIEGKEATVPDLPAAWLSMSKKDLSGTSFESIYEEEMAKSFLDTLNIAYVAFTRASEKLFILTRSEKKQNDVAINSLLKAYLEHAGQWQENKESYSFGKLEPSSKKQKEQVEEATPFRQLISSNWTRTLRMRSHHMNRSIVLEQDDALERGNLLHRAMEQIAGIDDVDKVLQAMADKGEISADIQTEWKQKIHDLLSNPAIAGCFARGVKAKREAGIYDAGGSFYRPDRVVFLENECVIIDYKTGRKYSRHEEQLKVYARMLKAMGHEKVKKVLLYLDQGTANIIP